MLRHIGSTLVATALLGSMLAKADDMAYLFSPLGSTTEGFGVVDLKTGVFTKLGVPQYNLGGLGELNNTIYADPGGSGPQTLWIVNPTNGNLTAAANLPASIQFGAMGSTTTGLYLLNSQATDLYSINPSTGTTTLIGSLGVAARTTGGLSVGANQLYYFDSDPGVSSLYTLNLSTGAATLIGNSSPPTCLKSTVFVDNTLYGASGYCSNPSETFSVDTTNGSVKLLGTGTFQDLNGLAPLLNNTNTAPEPGTVWLLIVGAAGLALVCLCRKAPTKRRNELRVANLASD